MGTAYQPTKVNMAELTARKDDSTSNDRPEVVKGAYQPVGKVDIAAIRAQAKDAKDDRPTVVKGAYEPVGKVDIAAIRAKAQAAPPSAGPAPNDEEDERPASKARGSPMHAGSGRMDTGRRGLRHLFQGSRGEALSQPRCHKVVEARGNALLEKPRGEVGGSCVCAEQEACSPCKRSYTTESESLRGCLFR